MVQGRVVRSGYVAPAPGENESSGNSAGNTEEPIIEVDGKLRFSLPGEAMFPSLDDNALLKPMLVWKLYSKSDAKLDAELAYVTTGMDWHADYSVIAPEHA